MNCWLLEFRFNKEILKNKEIACECIENVVDEISKGITDSKTVYEDKSDLPIKGFTVLNQCSKCTVLIQGMTDGLLTIDINALSSFESVDEQVIDEIRNKIFCIQNIFQRKTLEFARFPAIKRGKPYSVYDKTSFNSLVEYDYDDLVFDQNTSYQNVRILHSQQYGNCLVLDNDLNLAESDINYTIAITGNRKENYDGKEVLVLGAGDGGILNYLKNGSMGKPKMITMIEIDEVVITAARKHLRGICSDAMDQYDGENYKIIVGDCVKYLKKYAEEGQTFDYIINDLTAIPISTSPVGDHWDFLRLILTLSMDVLKMDGKYFTQGNGANNASALKMYEQQLECLNHSVSFSKETVCVPSYLELWIFYTIWKNKKIEEN